MDLQRLTSVEREELFAKLDRLADRIWLKPESHEAMDEVIRLRYLVGYIGFLQPEDIKHVNRLLTQYGFTPLGGRTGRKDRPRRTRRNRVTPMAAATPPAKLKDRPYGVRAVAWRKMHSALDFREFSGLTKGTLRRGARTDEAITNIRFKDEGVYHKILQIWKRKEYIQLRLSLVGLPGAWILSPEMEFTRFFILPAGEGEFQVTMNGSARGIGFTDENQRQWRYPDSGAS